MRSCPRLLPWEALAAAGSLALLLAAVITWLNDPHFFHISRTFECPAPPCIRKCCSANEELRSPSPGKSSVCSPTNTSRFSIAEVRQANNGNVWDNVRFTIITGNCVKYFIDPNETLLQEDGSVLYMDGEVASLEQYCIDFKADGTYVFICSSEDDDGDVFPLGMIISACSLFLTAMVYLLVWDSSKSTLRMDPTHTHIILNYLPTFMLAYVLLSIVQMNCFQLNDSIGACSLIAFVVQFSFLASFFWLNVMCFDIWWVFSDMRPVQERKHKKFMLYSLYAWGVPLVIVTISVAMDLVPSIPDSFIKPGFGQIKCWFKDAEGTLLYFYLPIGIVVILNIIMFVSTAIKLRAHTRSTKVLHSSESRRSNENDRDRYHLYLKLFIIMGINWIMELVSFFVGGPKSIWFVTDIGNTLQGVLIFVIFVCKRRILRLLNEKLCPRWRIIGDSSNSGRSKTEKPETAKTDSK